MTTRFVDNAATFVTGLTEADAYNTLGAAVTAASAGDIIRVKNTHTETAGAALSYNLPSGAGIQILSVAFNGSGTGALTAGGTANVGAANAALSVAGFGYIYGLTLNSGTNNAAACVFNLGGQSPCGLVFDTCTLACPSANSNARINFGPGGSTNNDDQVFIFKGCGFSRGNIGGFNIQNARIRFDECTLAGTAPGTVFSSTTGGVVYDVELQGCDLSGVAWTNLMDVTTNGTGRLRLVQCKLRASFTLTTGSFDGPGSPYLELIDCHSGDVNYYYAKSCWEGTILADNSVYYNASDGTTSISWLMTGNANSSFTWPLKSPPISTFNSTLSALTSTVEVTNDGTTFTDAQLWQETLAKVTSGVPLGTWNRADRAADITTAGTNQASSSVSWTGTGGFGGEVKQKLVSGSFTPAEIGPITTVVYLAANDNVYVSPRVTIA